MSSEHPHEVFYKLGPAPPAHAPAAAPAAPAGNHLMPGVYVTPTAGEGPVNPLYKLQEMQAMNPLAPLAPLGMTPNGSSQNAFSGPVLAPTLMQNPGAATPQLAPNPASHSPSGAPQTLPPAQAPAQPLPRLMDGSQLAPFMAMDGNDFRARRCG